MIFWKKKSELRLLAVVPLPRNCHDASGPRKRERCAPTVM
jgi:hypothetical protein